MPSSFSWAKGAVAMATAPVLDVPLESEIVHSLLQIGMNEWKYYLENGKYAKNEINLVQAITQEPEGGRSRVPIA
jgi:hypothetical protein